MLVRFLVRLLIAAGIATAVAGRSRRACSRLAPAGGDGGRAATSASGKAQALGVLAATGLVDVRCSCCSPGLMRIREVTSVIGLVTGRLRR